MSEEVKRKLKESGRGSYYNQDAWIQELEEEDPQVEVNVYATVVHYCWYIIQSLCSVGLSLAQQPNDKHPPLPL